MATQTGQKADGRRDRAVEARKETATVKAYLEALTTPKRRGRPVTREMLQERLAKVEERLAAEELDVLDAVELTQQKMQLEEQLRKHQDGGPDMEALEAEFKKVASRYAERKGIGYAAWRAIGVPARVLREAGIKETRRRN